ncbi:MAG: 3'-5' exonuclease domain-containing protein 2 [bacterium]|nr:3'-5' exonuclease domain-containing protein 2 [bacterium]
MPDKATVESFAPFEGLSLDAIRLVASAADAALALTTLSQQRVVGFDTESRPTFHRHQRSEGPHVVQFATLDTAFIFQTSIRETSEALVALLANPSLVKAGFGLANDLRHLHRKLNVTPAAILDLNHVFHAHGHLNAIGARGAIALLFHQRFVKSRHLTTSDWASQHLTDKQLLYAANDAYAAIRVYTALAAQGLIPTQDHAHQPV